MKEITFSFVVASFLGIFSTAGLGLPKVALLFSAIVLLIVLIIAGFFALESLLAWAADKFEAQQERRNYLAYQEELNLMEKQDSVWQDLERLAMYDAEEEAYWKKWDDDLADTSVFNPHFDPITKEDTMK